MVKRPIINTRDEPHANRDRYRRLHVIVGDSNMSEYSIYLKMGTSSLVLQMIEDGFITKDFSLRNPVKVIKDVSRDLACKLPIELANGRTILPVDLQHEYLQYAQRYVVERGGDAATCDVLQKWEHVLDRLAADPFRCNGGLGRQVAPADIIHGQTGRGFEQLACGNDGPPVP